MLKLRTLPNEQREHIKSELNKRAVSYQVKNLKADIPIWLKWAAVLFPNLAILIIFIQFLFRKNWIITSAQWKLYWKYIALGFLLWLLIFLAFSRFYLGSK